LQNEKEINLKQKKRMVINELEAVVESLKGKDVHSGGQTGFRGGWFDLLIDME